MRAGEFFYRVIINNSRGHQKENRANNTVFFMYKFFSRWSKVKKEVGISCDSRIQVSLASCLIRTTCGT